MITIDLVILIGVILSWRDIFQGNNYCNDQILFELHLKVSVHLNQTRNDNILYCGQLWV